MAIKSNIYAFACGLSLPLAAVGCSSPGVGSAKSTAVLPKESWTDKVARTFHPNSVQAAQAKAATEAPIASAPVSAAAKKKGPSADLSVAMAQMQERNANFDEASKLYHQALKADASHLGAHVGLARLHDRRNQLDEATSWYQKAVAKHPNEASVYNDLGLCYHRRGMLNEATLNLSQAVKLQPEKKLYRNNLANVFVESGRPDEALVHLKAAHGDAAAHYNLGYMLAQKGEEQRAVYHFQQAVALNPSLVEAHDWIARLNPGGANGYRDPVAVAQRPSREASNPTTTTMPVSSGRFINGRSPAAGARSTYPQSAPEPSIQLGEPNARPSSQTSYQAPSGDSGSMIPPAPERANPVRGVVRYPDRRSGDYGVGDNRIPPAPGDERATPAAAYEAAR